MQITESDAHLVEITMTFNFQHVTPDNIVEKAQLAGKNLTNLIVEHYGQYLEETGESISSWAH